jgi:hypothetical protein
MSHLQNCLSIKVEASRKKIALSHQVLLQPQRTRGILSDEIKFAREIHPAAGKNFLRANAMQRVEIKGDTAIVAPPGEKN